MYAYQSSHMGRRKIMEDQNIIILLDKFKKMLELGNKDKVILDMDATIITLERNVTKAKGLRIQPLLPETKCDKKINEIVDFINKRFPI